MVTNAGLTVLNKGGHYFDCTHIGNNVLVSNTSYHGFFYGVCVGQHLGFFVGFVLVNI